MHQSKYARDLLRRLNMLQSNLAGTPAKVGIFLDKETDEELVDPTHYRKIVGCLRFIQKSRQSHLLATKRILRYVQGTIGFGVLLSKGEAEAERELIGCSNSHWCGDKAEYIATSEIACQVVWLEALVKDLQVENLRKIKLLVDNKSAIDLARHPTSHERSKHIETRFYFLREQVNNEKLQIEHCRTEIQFPDILKWLRDSIGIVCKRYEDISVLGQRQSEDLEEIMTNPFARKNVV
ncbi:Copia protein, partial [Mucuna pruriens]